MTAALPASVTATSSMLGMLAHHACSISYDRMPQRARAQTILCIADTVACMASGSTTIEAGNVIAAELARASGGPVTVVGQAGGFAMDAAARINAYMGDVHELNDLICGHASIGSVSAALAVAQARGSTGRELIEAVAAGIETTSRIYSMFYPTMKPYVDVGIVCVGPVNTMGAAVAAARLLKLDEAQTLQAMANAGAQAGWCPAEVIFGDGGSVKPLLFGGLPAAAGISGALYAMHGVTGPSRLLESNMGYLATAAKSHDPRPAADTETWYVESPRRKLHACCGYIHSALDTVVALRHAGLDFADVQSIEVAVPEYIVAAITKPGPPRTPNEARFHLQYCLAVAADGQDVIVPQHSDQFATFLQKPLVDRLMPRIDVRGDARFKHYHESETTVVSRSGQKLAVKFNGAPKGSPQNELSDTEVWEKFARLTSTYERQLQAVDYRGRLAKLEGERETSWILRSFAPATP